jgi:hypothetical protein
LILFVDPAESYFDITMLQDLDDIPAFLISKQGPGPAGNDINGGDGGEG